MNIENSGVCPTLRRETHGHEPIITEVEEMERSTYDSRGNGDGRTSNTITGDHADRVTDYTPLVVEPRGDAQGKAMGVQQNASGELRTYDVSSTLGTNANASGGGTPR